MAAVEQQDTGSTMGGAIKSEEEHSTPTIIESSSDIIIKELRCTKHEGKHTLPVKSSDKNRLDIKNGCQRTFYVRLI